jgi:hypothetical protein
MYAIIMKDTPLYYKSTDIESMKPTKPVLGSFKYDIQPGIARLVMSHPAEVSSV